MPYKDPAIARKRAAEGARRRRTANREKYNAYQREYNREYNKRPEVIEKRAADVDKRRAYLAEYYSKPGKMEMRRASNTANARRYREDAHFRKKAKLQGYLRRYNLTEEALNDLLTLQAHTCAICDGGPGKQGWCVDHCHIEGHVRGVLCSKCNMALGLMNDRPEALRRAANYLENGRGGAGSGI